MTGGPANLVHIVAVARPSSVSSTFDCTHWQGLFVPERQRSGPAEHRLCRYTLLAASEMIHPCTSYFECVSPSSGCENTCSQSHHELPPSVYSTKDRRVLPTLLSLSPYELKPLFSRNVPPLGTSHYHTRTRVRWKAVVL